MKNEDFVFLSMEDNSKMSFIEEDNEKGAGEELSLITSDRHRKIQKKILICLSKYRYLDIRKLAKYLKMSQTVVIRELENFPKNLIVWDGREVRLEDYLYNSTKEEILFFWGD